MSQASGCALKRRARCLSDGLLDLLYPPRCLFCGRVLGARRECADCKPLVESLLHLPPRLPATEHCLSWVDGAAAVYYYSGVAAQAVRSAKRGGYPQARQMAQEMQKHLFGYTFSKDYAILTKTNNIFCEYNCVVAAPSHDAHGFHLAREIARELADRMRLPFYPQAIALARSTRRQEEVSGQDRLRNLVGTFKADAACVEGRRVLLVDDVITSGATVTECGRALLSAGAVSVFAVSFTTAEEK